MNNDAAQARKHGALGIASFSLALLIVLTTAAIVIVHGYLKHTTGLTSVSNLVLGTLVALIIIFSFVAVGLGIAGIADKSSKKVFPIFAVLIAFIPILVFAVAIFYSIAE